MSASAEPSEMPLPEGSQRRRKNNRACYPCQQAQRKCDRDWEIEGGSCLNCLNWGTRCIRLAPKPRTSKDRMNMANTIPYAAQAEPHLDNVSQNTGLRKGINYANRHFPGVFNEQRFVQRSWLSREVSSDDHEHFSPMLLLVFRLVNKDPREDGFRELLDPTKEAYGKESEIPTLATVMAATLLSWWLSRSKDHFRFAKDLLHNAQGWLSSCDERFLLRDASRDKIDRLLDQVRALAKEAGLGSGVQPNHEMIQRRPSASPRHKQESQPVIVKAPAQSETINSTNLGVTVPRDQLNFIPPAEQFLSLWMEGPAPAGPWRQLPHPNSPDFAGPSNGSNTIQVDPASLLPSSFVTGVPNPLAGVYDDGIVCPSAHDAQQPAFNQCAPNSGGCPTIHSPLPARGPSAVAQQAMTHSVGGTGAFVASNNGYQQVPRNSPRNYPTPPFIHLAQHSSPSRMPHTQNPHHQSWAATHTSASNMTQALTGHNGGVGTQMGPYPNANPGTSNGIRWKGAGGHW